jgi:transposase-like protein
VRHFPSGSLDSEGGKEKSILEEKKPVMMHPKAVSDPEVPEKAVRRRFTAAYKLRILKEAESCTEPGQIGALLRREGLYSSNLTLWRSQVNKGLIPKKRGPQTRKPDPQTRRIAELEWENAKLTHKLKQAELIIDVQKKWPNSSKEATRRSHECGVSLNNDVGISAACSAPDVPRAGFYRWRTPKEKMIRPAPPLALSCAERGSVLDLLHSGRFVDKAPLEIYATLLDEKEYVCSVRTMYRILARENELKERRRQVSRPHYAEPEILATGPNQAWSWDITKLKGPVKWNCFYLYVIRDIWSRYVVGWTVAHRESAALA